MPGLGIKRVLQATPVGYLAEMEDGSQVTFPEHVMVEAGYVGPTQGSQQPQVHSQQAQFSGAAEVAAPVQYVNETDLTQQLPKQNELGTTDGGVPPIPHGGPAPTQPAPGLAPGQSGGFSAGTSSEELVRRTDVNAPPALPDYAELDRRIAEHGTKAAGFANEATGHIKRAGDIETRGQEQLYGKYDDKGNLVTPGEAHKQSKALLDEAAADKKFNDVTAEAIKKRQLEIDESIASVPQVDPGKLWEDSNAFQNASGLIAATLGGMLAVSTGSGRNLGLEALERAIDRNIQAQRANIESEWKKIDHDEKSLEAYKDWRDNERSWTLEQSAKRRMSLANDLSAKSLTFASQTKRAELDAAAATQAGMAEKDAAASLTEYAKTVMARGKEARDQWFANESLSLDKLRTSADVSLKNAQAGALGAKTGEAADANPPIYKFANGDELYLDPRHTTKMTDKDWSDYSTAAQKKDAFIGEYDSLIRDLSQMGRRNLVGTGKRGLSDEDLNAVVARFNRMALNHTTELAATTFTDRLVDNIKSMMGGPTGLTDVNKIPAMLEFKKSVLSDADAKFRGKGAFIISGPKAAQPPGGVGPPSGETRRDVKPYSATARYGADPRVADTGEKPGQAIKGFMTEVLHGTDTNSQLAALEGLAEYAVSPVGIGGTALWTTLANSGDVKRGGKTGLASSGPALSKPDAINRLVLAGTRIKARHADDPDVAEAVDSRIKELVDAMTKVPKDPEIPYIDKQFNIR